MDDDDVDNKLNKGHDKNYCGKPCHICDDYMMKKMENGLAEKNNDPTEQKQK